MSFSSEAILVVDDDAFQLDLLVSQLDHLGFVDVLLASDGQQALAQFDLHRARVKLIISDLSMPDMDGLVLMRHLASRGFRGGMILLSGMHDDILNSAGGLAHAHGLNFLGCLSKPCDPLQLSQLLRSA
jgi:CheY-like chemotaxis protein